MIKDIKFLSLLVTVMLPTLVVLSALEELYLITIIGIVYTILWTTLCVVLSFEETN